MGYVYSIVIFIFEIKFYKLKKQKLKWIGGLIVLLITLLYVGGRRKEQTENGPVNIDKLIHKHEVNSVDSMESIPSISVPVLLDFPQFVPVKSRVDGELERVEDLLKNGQFVQKGELLAQINNRIPFQQLLQTKHQLKDQLMQLMKSPVTSRDFPIEKWRSFESSISPVQLLPAFPTVDSKEEQTLIQAFSILNFFQASQQLESGMKDYFLLAPKAGILSHVQAKAGSMISKNTVIARIYDQKDTLIRCEVDAELAEKIRSSNSIIFKTNAISTAVHVRSIKQKRNDDRVLFEIQLPSTYRKQLTKNDRPQLIVL